MDDHRVELWFVWSQKRWNTFICGILTNYLEKVRPISEKLSTTDFMISENIIEELLRKNNEIDGQS